MKYIKNITKILLILLFSSEAMAQSYAQFLNEEVGVRETKFIGKRELKIRRSGPYVGLQAGKYYVLELGVEMQWNRVKLVKPITHAIHTGFNYNFFNNVLGYDAGYWCKVGRMNLTYGGNLTFRTDFDNSALGLSPVVGFKFWQLHLQTGYNFMGKTGREMETNTFFVSLRYVFIQNRDWKWKKKSRANNNQKTTPGMGVRWL